MERERGGEGGELCVGGAPSKIVERQKAHG